MKKMKPILLLATMGMLVNAGAQTAFPPGTNVALTKPGMNSAAKVYTIYTSTNASNATGFTAGVTINPTYDINGIGLNPVDNLVYGASFVGADNTVNNNVGVSLRRLGADGTMIDLGLLPTTGQTGVEFPNFSAGTISTNGAYYYMTFGLKPSGITKYLLASIVPLNLNANDVRMFLCWVNNVSALPANAGNNIAGGISGFYELNFSNTDITAAINAFLTQVNASYPDVYNADGGIQDLAISPIDAKVYGYISYPSGSNTVGRPVVMNAPVAGIAAILPVGTTVNTVPNQEVAGVQFDAAGNFYGLFTTGDYAQINLSTGALSGLTMSNIPTTGGNLRGDLAAAVTNVPFPVKMISFEGKSTDAANELTWTTASEQNNHSFRIERSTDSRNWTTLGTVNSKAPNGNSSEKLSYTFNDNNPQAGMLYYRLVQTDLDGKSVIYPSYVSLTTLSGNTVRVYPNPATNTLHISGINAGTQIRIADLSGKIILSQNSNAATEGVMNVDIRQLPSNLYLLQIVAHDMVQSAVRFIKK